MGGFPSKPVGGTSDVQNTQPVEEPTQTTTPPGGPGGIGDTPSGMTTQKTEADKKAPSDRWTPVKNWFLEGWKLTRSFFSWLITPITTIFHRWFSKSTSQS